MNADQELLLLDTSIVVHLIRGNQIGRKVDAAFGLRHRSERPLISVVTIGECLSLARQFQWGAAKSDELASLLQEFVVVDLDSRPVLERYGELHAWTRSIGRTLGQNDLWIGATAAATGAHLLTSDKDFDPLHPDYIQRTIILAE